MSTQTWNGRAGGKEVTDRVFIPITRVLTKAVNKMSDRRDLTARILNNTGAPARFIQNEAVVDINTLMLNGIDPTTFDFPSFAALHPDKAGLVVHEACHARASYLLDLKQILKEHGKTHMETFKMLEEARCETQSLEHLSVLEKFALQSSILDQILGDMDAEKTKDDIETSSPERLIQAAGLMLGRIDAKLLDTSNAKGLAIKEALEKGLEEYYEPLYKVAVKFAHCKVNYWESDQKEMHELVDEWNRLAAEFLKSKGIEPPPDGPGGCTLPGTGGKEGKEGNSTSSGGKGKSEEESEESGSGGKGGKEKSEEGAGGEKEPGNGNKNPDGTAKEPPTVEETDDGEVGDGSMVLTKVEDNSGTTDASLGTYAGGTSIDDLMIALEKDMRAADEEIVRSVRSKLGVELQAIQRADALSHQERRRRNKDAAKLWK